VGGSWRLDLKLRVLLLRRSKHIDLLASVLLNLQLRVQHLLGLLRQMRRLSIGTLDRYNSKLRGTPTPPLHLLLLLLQLLLLVLLVGRLVDKHNTACLSGLYSLLIRLVVLLVLLVGVVLSSMLPVGGIRLRLVVTIVHVIVQGLVLLLIMGLVGGLLL